jgi:hypothetical protein
MGASLLIMLYLAKHDPALLRRRLAGGPMVEKEPQQKIIMVVVSIGFVGLLGARPDRHRGRAFVAR